MNQIQEIQERQNIESAIDALKDITGFKITWTQTNAHDNGINGFITFGKEIFPIQQKQDFTLSKLPSVLQEKIQHPNILLISNSIADNVKEILRNYKINYLDILGNSYIRLPKGLIFIDRKKTIKKVEKNKDKDKAFTKKGIVLVFHFLNDEHLLNRTYRHISEVTKASLDTITKVFESLKQQGFLFQKNDKTLVLVDKKRLFEKWADAYDSRSKPPLIVGKFRFLNQEMENNWQKMPFNPTTIWGGEPASDILTNYLQPEIYTLYSSETKAELIKNYRILPDPKGNIHVYMPFTIFENGITSKEFPNAATPLLVYADMLNSNSGRNHEVAQLIYEKYVKQLFQ